MTWKEVLGRDDIVGGDIETHEDGVTYRGPISAISIEDGFIRIESPWVAVMNQEGGWQKNETNDPILVSTEYVQPLDIGNGRIAFDLIALGYATIFPKGGDKLESNEVKGLEI